LLISANLVAYLLECIGVKAVYLCCQLRKRDAVQFYRERVQVKNFMEFYITNCRMRQVDPRLKSVIPFSAYWLGVRNGITQGRP